MGSFRTTAVLHKFNLTQEDESLPIMNHGSLKPRQTGDSRPLENLVTQTIRLSTP